MMTGELAADVGSALDLSAIPAEASGPESLGTLDSPVETTPASSNEPSPEEAPGETPESDLEAVPVLDMPPAIEEGAISIAEGSDLILEGGDKVEW